MSTHYLLTFNIKAMSHTDTLIERFKRSNATEQEVLTSLVEKHPDIIIFDKLNTEDIVRQRIKQTEGNVRLFLDVETPNLTAKGNYKKIEFLLVDAMNNFYWFDAKHSNTTTNITDLHGEYNRAKNCKGVVVFVVKGKGYSKNVLREHNSYLKELNIHEKVKVVEFCNLF